MTPGKVFLLITGVLFALIATGLGVGGASLVWAGTVMADGDGYIETNSQPFSSDGYAVTGEDINLHSDVPGEWLPWAGGLDVRLEVEADAPQQEVFIGIARSADVDRYLAGARHDEIAEIRDGDVRYDTARGEDAPTPPAQQTFWAASGQGRGTQSLSWQPEPGRWSVVVMNADAAPGVTVNARVGADTGILLPIGIALLVCAFVLVALAVALIVAAASRPAPPPGREGGVGAATPPAQPVGAGANPSA